VVTVLPSSTPPALRDSATQAASRSGCRPLWIGVPHSVGMSKVSMMSLTPNGTPASGPRFAALVKGAGSAKPSLGIDMRPGMHLMLARMDAVEARAHHRFAGGAAVSIAATISVAVSSLSGLMARRPPRWAAFNHHGFAGR